jgi:hypothetical protein
MVKLTTTYTAAFGEYLKVVGGPPELGAWDAGAAPALTWGEGDVWTATLELPAGEHEFKVCCGRGHCGAKGGGRMAGLPERADDISQNVGGI